MFRGHRQYDPRTYSCAELAKRNYEDKKKAERKQVRLAIFLCVLWFFSGFFSYHLFFR